MNTINTSHSLSLLPNLAGDIGLGQFSETPEDLAAVGKKVEGVFASLLIKEMRETLDEGMFGSEGGDVYGGLFDMMIGQTIGDSQPFGIGQMIQSYLKEQTTSNLLNAPAADRETSIEVSDEPHTESHSSTQL